MAKYSDWAAWEPPEATPVNPADVPTDIFACGMCDAPLPLLGVVGAVEHDCSTGEVTPI
jgi:hypothetical protein